MPTLGGMGPMGRGGMMPHPYGAMNQAYYASHPGLVCLSGVLLCDYLHLVTKRFASVMSTHVAEVVEVTMEVKVKVRRVMATS